MPIKEIDIRKTYFYQEVQRLEYEEGCKEGFKEGVERVAINLIKKSMTTEFICECTTVSIERVKELSENLK